MSDCKYCKERGQHDEGISDLHTKLTKIIDSSDIPDHELGFGLIMRGVEHLIDKAPTYEVGFRTALAGFDAGIKLFEANQECEHE